MKKIVYLLLIVVLLYSCGDAKPGCYITSVSTNDTHLTDTAYKYKNTISCKNTNWSDQGVNLVIYTKEQYNIGDTLKFSRRR